MRHPLNAVAVLSAFSLLLSARFAASADVADVVGLTLPNVSPLAGPMSAQAASTLVPAMVVPALVPGVLGTGDVVAAAPVPAPAVDASYFAGGVGVFQTHGEGKAWPSSLAARRKLVDESTVGLFDGAAIQLYPFEAWSYRGYSDTRVPSVWADAGSVYAVHQTQGPGNAWTTTSIVKHDRAAGRSFTLPIPSRPERGIRILGGDERYLYYQSSKGVYRVEKGFSERAKEELTFKPAGTDELATFAVSQSAQKAYYVPVRGGELWELDLRSGKTAKILSNPALSGFSIFGHVAPSLVVGERLFVGSGADLITIDLNAKTVDRHKDFVPPVTRLPRSVSDIAWNPRRGKLLIASVDDVAMFNNSKIGFLHTVDPASLTVETNTRIRLASPVWDDDRLGTQVQSVFAEPNGLVTVGTALGGFTIRNRSLNSEFVRVRHKVTNWWDRFWGRRGL